VALLLRKQGIQRIRPLAGGLGAWRERGYPISVRPPDQQVPFRPNE
jgi:3-mercaptopyruvate sulfurtransferase SseA